MRSWRKHDIRNLVIWCVILTIAMIWISFKKENYTDLWKRVRNIEIKACIDVPAEDCRPSLGWSCEKCD